MTLCPRAKAESELAALRRLGARLVVLGDGEYPASLAAIDDAPPVLALRGDGAVLARPAVAIVGARNASLNGVRVAQRLAADLAAAGCAIVSGLARGIDTAAHDAAGPEATVAVLAGGIDVVYPPENRALQDRIGERGLLVAELPPGTEPLARHFPRRNRIVSGLSLGVVVVEAAPLSGSLITARFALEQGREVFAVPGSPLDPRSEGTNELLRQGATLTTSAGDILTALGRQTACLAAPEGGETTPPDTAQINDSERKLVSDRLGATPVPVDELVRECQLSAAAVLTILLELELAGRLARHPGNQVSLTGLAES